MTTNKKQVNQRDINNIKKGKLITKFEMKERQGKQRREDKSERKRKLMKNTKLKNENSVLRKREHQLKRQY